MGILNWLIGFRWSLYVMNGDKLMYVLNENNAMCLAGFLIAFYRNGGEPLPPWSLHLVCNKRHQSFEVLPEHFSKDGNGTTALLTREIEAIDPNWRVPDADPVFIEASTNKRIPISHDLSDVDAVEAYLTAERPRQPTYFSIMSGIFGRSRA